MSSINRIGQSRVIGSSTSSSLNRLWYGDGSDGDAVIAADTELEVALDEGQIIKNYNSLTINEGVTLKPANRCNGMVLLVRGDLIVNGTISADKCAPLLNSLEESSLSQNQIKLCGSLLGGTGGNGGDSYSNSYGTSAGGTASAGYALGGGWPGGGAAAPSSSTQRVSEPGGDGIRAAFGTTFPYPAPDAYTIAAQYGAGGSTYSSTVRVGGSAPGGGGATGNNAGKAGDGYPGGAIWIFVGGNVTISGTGKITACGGDGGAGIYDSSYKGYSGGGGGGGGGVIAIVYGGTYTNNGSIRVDGGNGGTCSRSACSGSSGLVGSTLISSFDSLKQFTT